MEDRERAPERDLPPQLVLRELVIERVTRTGRRFQLVKLDEPGDDLAVTMLRGLREQYEKAHGVPVPLQLGPLLSCPCRGLC